MLICCGRNLPVKCGWFHSFPLKSLIMLKGELPVNWRSVCLCVCRSPVAKAWRQAPPRCVHLHMRPLCLYHLAKSTIPGSDVIMSYNYNIVISSYFNIRFCYSSFKILISGVHKIFILNANIIFLEYVDSLEIGNMMSNFNKIFVHFW